nr:replication initiator protein A [Anaerobutyricum hallii]
MEAEQYSFYRVPKVLFTEPCFKTLSCEAKVLYGLMLDRRNRVVPTSWCRQCLHR